LAARDGAAGTTGSIVAHRGRDAEERAAGYPAVSKARGFSPRETDAAMQPRGMASEPRRVSHPGVSLRSIQRVYEKIDKHGIVVPKVQRKRAPTFSGPEGDAIREWVEKQTKGYFLDQLLEWFRVAFPHRVVWIIIIIILLQLEWW